MLPGAIVWLPSLPLNASGKVDRRALPRAAASRATARRGVRVPPRDMFEHMLARIWEDLLGVRDDRRASTTSSRSAATRCSRRGSSTTIERETGLAVPLTAMFVDDTIAGLARALREGAPPISAVERFMSHYFLVAKEVGELTGIVCSALELKQLKSLPTLDTLLAPFSWRRRAKLRRTSDFRIENGRISAVDKDAFRKDR